MRILVPFKEPCWLTRSWCWTDIIVERYATAGTFLRDHPFLTFSFKA